MKHAPAAVSAARRSSPLPPAVLVTLAAARLAQALAVIGDAWRRWPLLAFALVELAAVLVAVLLALVLLPVLV